ncbi:hypothetical protein [Variovorax sp. W2I14]|uniref:hypothetical protein n=1 Tax=Variovorax sp. W2I14 TaxID=3042290 RepID=UPI003D253374
MSSAVLWSAKEGERGEGGEGRRLTGLHHQFGAEAVAPVGVAQAREGERGGGNQRLRHRIVGAQLECGQVDVDAPGADLRYAGLPVFACAAVQAVAAEQAGDRLLHRVVVVVAHLRLAVFEGPVAWLSCGEEQIGVGMARALQVRLDGFGRGRPGGGTAGLAGRKRDLQPHFREGGEPLFIAEAGGVGQGLAAGLSVRGALVGVRADHAQHLLRRGAELAGDEHVAAALRQVFGGRDRADRDARAAGQQQCGAQQGRQCEEA